MKIVHMFEQGSDEWHLFRIGRFTSSKIGDLLQKGKTDEFGQKAITYMYQVASERNLDKWVLDNLKIWLERTSPFAKALQYGTDNEKYARDEYQSLTGYKVRECGLVEREDIPFYSDSPDGIIIEENGVLEIKCPYTSMKHLMYCQMKSAEDLKKAEPEYYWQCQSHILANDALWCDFVSYDMFQKKTLHIVRINRNEEDIQLLMERISLANKWVENLLEQINQPNEILINVQ